MTIRGRVVIAAVVASNALAVETIGQPASPQFADTNIIVKVLEGVEPQPLPDGRMSFRYVVDTDLPQELILLAEWGMADVLQACAVTSIEPMIRFTPKNEALAIEIGLNRFYTVSVPSGTDTALMVEVCNFFVTHLEFASVSWYAEFFAQPPDDPKFSDQWGLDNTGQEIDFHGRSPECDFEFPGTPNSDVFALEAWTLETGSQAIKVATIDTGADPDHPDLVNKLDPGQNFVQGEGEDPNDTSDSVLFSHGTFIAGIIGAETNNAQGIAGLCQGCKIIPIKFHSDANGNQVQWAVNGIIWAADHGADVISISFAGSEVFLRPAIDYATDPSKDVLVVAAAGNGGAIGYPARDSRVIAVGATDAKDGLSCFSSTGPELSVVAPGEELVSTWNPEVGPPSNVCVGQLYCMSFGTSFSTPFVSGLAGLIRSANPSLTNDEVKQVIESTADDLGVLGKDDEFGNGRINAYVAVCTARGLACMGDANGDGSVGVPDLLTMLAGWGGGAGPGDFNCDFGVNVPDLLILLAAWGCCPDSGCLTSPPSLEEEIVNAGLDWPGDWNQFMECLDTGTPEEVDNCICWMHHYLDGCEGLNCHHGMPCPDDDPWGGPHLFGF